MKFKSKSMLYLKKKKFNHLLFPFVRDNSKLPQVCSKLPQVGAVLNIFTHVEEIRILTYFLAQNLLKHCSFIP